MKNYLKSFLIVVSLLLVQNFNARSQSIAQNEYIEAYSKLSPEQQQSYIEDFAKKLSVDEDYRNLRVGMERMKDYILQMKKIPGDTVKNKRGTAEEINYYKQRGMTNPEDYIKYRASLPQYILKIRSKFPAYGKLDRAVMRQITQKADTLIKSM